MQKRHPLPLPVQEAVEVAATEATAKQPTATANPATATANQATTVP